MASGLHHYHETGTQHQKAGSGLSEVLANAAKVFKSDDVLEEPLAKVRINFRLCAIDLPGSFSICCIPYAFTDVTQERTK